VLSNLSEGSIVGVYKPKGPSSFKMVGALRRLTQIKCIGHAGTLDPAASGVLVMAIGRSATKQLATYVLQEKEYIAEVRLGATSTTDDEEGEILELAISNDQLPNMKDIVALLPQFTGTIEQIPPAFSAVKLNGQRAYTIARKGKLPELAARTREVQSIEILTYSWPILKLRIVTGKGVYIRSLARDIGSALGVGGYLTSLVRTRVGQFTLEDALRIDL
jgi:tRNA pseudouridine55 synthase